MADNDHIYTLIVRDASGHPAWQRDQHVSGDFANARAFMDVCSDPKHTVKEMKLPASVVSLHGFDFTGHRSLAVVDPSSTSIEKIGNRTFAGCKSLRTALLPKTCKELGLGGVFSRATHCSTLT